jgi:hypothetical protein
MEVDQLFQDFQYQDLQWFIPVLAGLVIIVGGILVAFIRNFTAGVIVALLFGGLMTMSALILNTLQRPQDPVAFETANVARSAAELAVLNGEVVRDLSRVVVSLRSTLDGLRPMVAPDDRDPPDAAVAQRFTQSLMGMEDRLDEATDAVQRAGVLRAELENDLRDLEDQIRRAGAR